MYIRSAESGRPTFCIQIRQNEFSGWTVTAVGGTVFNSTSFNEGTGGYHTKRYYTNILNASRQAGVVEQQLLQKFLCAWREVGQHLRNWTFTAFKGGNEEKET